MNKKRFDVVTIGDCKADQFIQLGRYRLISGAAGGRLLAVNFGQKIPVSKFGSFAGGNALNAAVTFSRMGLAAAVQTILGSDHDAEHVLEVMRREKIGTDLAVRQKNSLTDKSVILVAGGERTVLGYHDEKNYRLLPKFRSSWVYLTSLGKEFGPVYRRVLAEKKTQKYKIAFNPGTRQLLYAISAVRSMVKEADLLFVNIEEAQRLVARKSRDLKFLLAGLKKMGAGISVVTDGARGAYALAGDFYKISGFPAKRVDSTGAGDAFASAFTAAIIKNLPVAEALRWGSVNAAGEIGQIGVHTGLLSGNQLIARLRGKTKYQARTF